MVAPGKGKPRTGARSARKDSDNAVRPQKKALVQGRSPGTSRGGSRCSPSRRRRSPSARPDVVALQEVTARTLPLWRGGAAGAPPAGVASGFARRHPPAPPPACAPRRRAARGHGAARALPAYCPVRWPETALAARLRPARGPHRPRPECRERRDQAGDAGRGPHRAPAGRGAQVACGDLNTPRREQRDGARLLTFARDSRGRLRGARRASGTRRARRRPRSRPTSSSATPSVPSTATAKREPSWTFGRIAGHGGGWRLDHVFVRRRSSRWPSLPPRLARRGAERPRRARGRPRASGRGRYSPAGPSRCSGRRRGRARAAARAPPSAAACSARTGTTSPRRRGRRRG